MIDRPEPETPFEVRLQEMRAAITDPSERAVFERVVDHIDRRALAEARARHQDLIKGPGFAGFGKYLDVCYWVRDKIGRSKVLGLFGVEPRRVLDLGTGAGHWLAVCGALGHEAIGLDIDNPILIDLCSAMGVDRRAHRIRPHEALPDLGRFDVVTAFAINFDSLGRDAEGHHLYWSLDDWDYFLRDVTGDRMRYPGALHLQLNSRNLPSGERVPFTEVIEAFAAAGATMTPAGRGMQFDVAGPIGLRLQLSADRAAIRAQTAANA